MHAFAEMLEKYLRSNTEILASVSDPAALLEGLLEQREAGGPNLPVVYRSVGLSPEDALCVAVIEGKDRTDTPMLAVLREGLEAELGKAAVFSHGRQVVCLLRLGADGDCAKAAKRLRALVPQDSFIWGLSYEFTGIDKLPEHYRLACAALDRAAEEGRTGATLYDAAAALMGRLCARDGEARRLVHPDLARLREADPQYAATLYEYLLCGGNYTDTAARMGLHRNSLIYRMNKIRAVMRTNPDDLENRKLLLFSFLLEG